MDFSDLRLDLTSHAKRVARAKYLELAPELRDNLLPFLDAVLETVDERFGKVEQTLTAIIEETESVLQPQAAMRILEVFDASKVICEKALAGAPDLAAAITEYRALVDEVGAEVVSITLEDDEDEEGEDEEDEGEEAAAAATPAPSQPGAAPEVK